MTHDSESMFVAEPAARTPATVPAVSEPVAARGLTGDHAVDDVLGQLDQVTGESLDTQIEVAEQVQRVLQGRLADLGRE